MHYVMSKLRMQLKEHRDHIKYKLIKILMNKTPYTGGQIQLNMYNNFVSWFSDVVLYITDPTAIQHINEPNITFTYIIINHNLAILRDKTNVLTVPRFFLHVLSF